MVLPISLWLRLSSDLLINIYFSASFDRGGKGKSLSHFSFNFLTIPDMFERLWIPPSHFLIATEIGSSKLNAS